MTRTAHVDICCIDDGMSAIEQKPTFA